MAGAVSWADVARFRLKFLLQEFDLRGPEVVIGRSPQCQVTLEDPLVSREHAKIVVEEERAVIHDLGSRNGVTVNGEQVRGSRTLIDADRIRLGTQELVFYIGRRGREARTTGFLTTCTACGTPFPDQAPVCPHCGAPPRDEDTMSGLLIPAGRRSWTFQLLGEVIERALATNRGSDAERIMRRAAKEVDDQLAAGDSLGRPEVRTITGYALRLAQMLSRVEWVHWALNVHRHHVMFPSDELLERLEALDAESLPDIVEVLADFAKWAASERESLRPPPLPESVDRLERISRPSDVN